MRRKGVSIIREREFNGYAPLGIADILGIVFIILKLTGNITWPWVWVLAPFWIPLAVLACILVFVLIGVGVTGAIDKRRKF